MCGWECFAAVCACRCEPPLPLHLSSGSLLYHQCLTRQSCCLCLFFFPRQLSWVFFSIQWNQFRLAWCDLIFLSRQKQNLGINGGNGLCKCAYSIQMISMDPNINPYHPHSQTNVKNRYSSERSDWRALQYHPCTQWHWHKTFTSLDYSHL